jgi:hypothetical protein
MPAKKEAAKKRKRGPSQLTAGHKAAMAQGRRESAVVGAYLDALEAFKPKRGRKRTAENIEKRLSTIDKELPGADRLAALNYLQERANLVAELDAMQNKTDLTELEAAFVEVAAAYGERKGISYSVWREVGVSAATLRDAGITR